MDSRNLLSLCKVITKYRTVPYALTGLAALETRQRASQTTLELVLYILEHPAAAQETKIRAGRLRLELESRLSYETIEAAQELAVSKSLEDFVHRFLVGGWSL